MIVWMIVYFLTAMVLMALVMLPALRQWLFGVASRCWSWVDSGMRTRVSQSRQSAKAAQHSMHSVAESLHNGAAAIARRKWLTAGVAALVLGPPLAAVLLRRRNVLEFDDSSHDINEQIATLLRGEQLVPPAPLPPDVFVTSEVTILRPQLASASRDWALLDADFRQRLLVVYRLMALQGYEMALIEGYRSPERQDSLARQNDRVVTNAMAYQSYHQYGLAADSAFYRDGKLVISEQDSWAMRGYQMFGAMAQQVGLVWGGAWRLRDFGHVELRRPQVRSAR